MRAPAVPPADVSLPAESAPAALFTRRSASPRPDLQLDIPAGAAATEGFDSPALVPMTETRESAGVLHAAASSLPLAMQHAGGLLPDSWQA